MRLIRCHHSNESSRIPWLVLATAVLAGSVDDLSAQQAPPGWNAPAAGYRQPAQNWPRPNAAAGQSPIQLVQRRHVVTADDTKPKRPLPFPLSEMPDIMEEMEVIHRRSQLVVSKAPVSRIAIADDAVVDVVQYSPTEFGIIGLALGTTNLTLWFDDSPEPLIYLVEVIRDPTYEERLRTDFGKLEKQLHILFPYSTVQLIPLQNRLVVRGQARDAEEAARILQIVRAAFFNQFGSLANSVGGGGGAGFGGGGGGGFGGGGFGNNNNNNGDDEQDDFIVNMLQVPGNHQVMLHVKIAEINRTQGRQLALDLDLQDLANNGRHQLAALLGGGAGATLTGVFENGEINVFLKWLAEHDTSKVLAAPTLTVLSGHQASFLAGGEFPVPTIVGVGGAAGTTTSFRGYGTSLLVQPEVIDKDWIKLQITPEYSNLDQDNAFAGGQGLNTRRAQTTVKLREGQTIVLAGLYGSAFGSTVNRIPFLGELPIIGPALFNSKQSSRGDNELLILVTPELVRPMDPEEVPPLPGFYVTPPNDIELYAYAKTEGYPDQGVYQLSPLGWGPGYANEVGYRVFNAPSYSNPTPYGGGGGGGAFPGGSGGAFPPGGQVMQPQPQSVYPGPPVAPAGPIPQGVPPMAPGAGQPMQPYPDPAMSQNMPSSGMIQQVSYEQPQSRNPITRWFGRDTQVPTDNPAVLSTNATTPSLRTGTDSRLGSGRPATNRQQQQNRMQPRVNSPQSRYR